MKLGICWEGNEQAVESALSLVKFDEDNQNMLKIKGDKVVKTFDSEEDAKDFAKSKNKQLSQGEKKYYNMKYKAVKTK